MRPAQTKGAPLTVSMSEKDGRPDLCNHYCKLNKVMIQDLYPIPRMDELIESFAVLVIFSKLDVIGLDWKVEIYEGDQNKHGLQT